MKTTSFRAAGRLTDSNMERLQKTNKFVERPTTTLLYQIAGQVIPILIIMAVLYFLFCAAAAPGGQGSPQLRQEPRQAADEGPRQSHLRDVAGCDEAKEEVSEVVEFLRDPRSSRRWAEGSRRAS